MPCFSPLAAYQPPEGAIVFREVPGAQPIQIACGQCIGCRLERSRQWAMRCVHESQLHEFSSFITLTYDDEHLPVDHSLRYPDFQLFMKRLRARYSERQRQTDKCVCKELRQSMSSAAARERCPAQHFSFFMCGEYGERTARPHYHACIFGLYLSDRVLYKQLDSGSNLYTSKTLESLWPFGFSSVGDVTFESAAYVARYVVKKVTGAPAEEHYKYVSPDGEVFQRVPEFTHMSLNPAIAKGWYEKFSSEVFPRDEVVMRGKLMKPPKYYDNLLEKTDFDTYEHIQAVRYNKGSAAAEDATPERLRVKEKVTRAGLTFKRRTLE